MEIALIVVGSLVGVAIIYYIGKFVLKKVKAEKKNKPVKAKTPKKVKEKKNKKENSTNEFSGCYVDKVEKYLYRKELKVLIAVNQSLPKNYVAFPKVSVSQILVPLGGKDLYESAKNSLVDIVIFDQFSMQPKIAIDIFDNTLDDEEMEIQLPAVAKALEIAKIPLIKIKVKGDYSDADIKQPVLAEIEKIEKANKDISVLS